MSISARRLVTVLGLAACVASVAAAQTPVVPLPSGEAPRPVVVPAQDQPTLEPVRPATPPPAAADLGQSVTPGLMREGSLISQAVARVVQGKSGRWYAIFDAQASGRVLPPMILLESASLQAVTRAAERAGPSGRLRLSGSVTVYRNHNYLLPSAAPIVERTETAPVQPAQPAPTSAEPAKPAAPAGTNGGEPSIDQIVAELDKAAGARPEAPSVRIAQQAAETPVQSDTSSETASRVMPAGFLAGRKARVVRGPEGRLMARFDNGPAGTTEPAMTLLPCQNTAAIEALADSFGDLGTLTISGHVQVYRNRNYLLPTMYVVNRTTEQVTPAQ